MLKRLLKIFKPTTRQPTAVTKRLIPDPDKVTAGFSIWLRSLRKADDDWMALNKELKAYWNELAERGMKQNEAGIPLDSPFTEEISRQLNKLKREPHFKGTATLNFKLRQDVTTSWEWYEIRPAKQYNPPLDSRKFTCRAELMPHDLHWFGDGFVSEKCKAVIEDAGLTGLEFTWIPDVGNYQAPQWFHAMAAKSLGRGLDNPLVDPTKIILPDAMKNRYSYETWRFGLTRVGKSNIVNDPYMGIPLADEIVDLSSALEISINGFRQMLRGFLPLTDFAYIWHWVPSPCCNARARDMLIQNGLLSQSDFIPIWIWDEVPEGAAILDDPNISSIPPFPMALPEWQEFQKLLPQKRNEFSKNPKPRIGLNFDNVFQKFCQSLGKEYSDKSKISQSDTHKTSTVLVDINIPILWDKILKVSDDFSVNTDKNELEGFVHGYEVIPKNQLVDFNESQRYMLRRLRETCAGRDVKWDESNFVHFAGSDGDSLSFDMSTLTKDGDCKVVEWTHDSLGIGREWPSLIQLLHESIELAESEGNGD